MDFSRFLVPNLSQLPEGNSKNRGFFRYLGPTWANLGEKGVPRCPKTSQESQNGSNKRPKRAKMRPKGAPREPQWPPKYPKMFTQPSRRPHTTFLSQASMKSNFLRSKRGGFQGSLPLIRLPQGPGFGTYWFPPSPPCLFSFFFSFPFFTYLFSNFPLFFPSFFWLFPFFFPTLRVWGC